MACDIRLISKAAVLRGDVAILADKSAIVLAAAPDPVLNRLQVIVFDRLAGAPILGGWCYASRGDKYIEGLRVIDDALIYDGVTRDFRRLWEKYKAGENHLVSVFHQCGRSYLSAKDIISCYDRRRQISPGIMSAARFVDNSGEVVCVPIRFRG